MSGYFFETRDNATCVPERVRTVPNVAARCVPNPRRDVCPFSDNSLIVMDSSILYNSAKRDSSTRGITVTSGRILFFFGPAFFVVLRFYPRSFVRAVEQETRRQKGETRQKKNKEKSKKGKREKKKKVGSSAREKCARRAA
jgi:hypothetical protein